MSFSRILLTFLFISANQFITKKTQEDLDIHPKLFSWKNNNIFNIFVYSLSLCVGYPLLINIQKNKPFFFEKAFNIINNAISYEKEPIEMIYKTFSETLLGQLIALLIKIDKKMIFWLIFTNTLRNSIKEYITNFQNFWKEVNEIDKKVNLLNFFIKKFSSNEYLENEQNKIEINFCYETFNLIPDFIKDYYIKDIESSDKLFLIKLKNVLKLIDRIEQNVKNKKERNFLIYKIFNNCSSLKDLDTICRSIKNIP